MSPAHQAPLIITSDDIADLAMPLDGDCACPRHVAPALPPASALLHSPWLAPAMAYRQPLGAGYAALLPAAGAGRLMVLNRAALQIWEAFAGGRHISAVITALQPQQAAAEVRAAVAKLQAYGLLSDPGVALPGSPPSDTLVVWLHATNACNLRCSYCYVRKSEMSMAPELGEQAIEAVVRAATEHGYARIQLKYAGGEALLNPDAIIRMQQRAVELCDRCGLGLDGVVLSNGTTLGARACRMIRDLGLRLVVSLDAIDAAQDAQRPRRSGEGSLSHALRGIQRAIASGIRPHLSITITEASVAALADLVAWALERELSFQFNFARETGTATTRARLWGDDPAVADGLRRALGVIEANPPRWSLLASLADRANLSLPHEHVCGAGRDYLVIDHMGRIAQCQMLLDRPVATIAADDLLAAVRQPHEGFSNPPGAAKKGCAACVWRLWCAGGCPVAAYRATGYYDTSSPHCALYQKLLPEIVRMEGRRILTYYEGA